MNNISVTNQINIEKLFHAKMTYGQLFLFNIGKDTYVFRPLTIKELEAVRSLINIVSECFLEDWILLQCFIYGTQNIEFLINNERFMIAKNISVKILEKSNIPDEAGLVSEFNKSRELANTIQETFESFISKAFPIISPSQVKDFTTIQQLNLAAKAEVILGTTLNIGKPNVKKHLEKYRFAEGAEVLGVDDIVSPRVADKFE